LDARKNLLHDRVVKCFILREQLGIHIIDQIENNFIANTIADMGIRLPLNLVCTFELSANGSDHIKILLAVSDED